MNKFKIGIVQMKVIDDKIKNLEKARQMITNAHDKGVDIVVLPEMFNCPYDSNFFREYAENENNSITVNLLRDLSKSLGIYIVGGSIPEIENNNIYNTSFIFGNGKILGKHRKIHLFDIDIKNKITFNESDILSRGNEITLIDTKFTRIGVAICYDIRFPELIRIMALKGAKVIIIPGAFNMTTGPSHWELLFRSRSLDNQIYMIGASPARDNNSNYIAYGNSLVTNPWGEVVNRLDENEDILVSEIDLDCIESIREQLPLINHRREDLYILSRK